MIQEEHNESNISIDNIEPGTVIWGTNIDVTEVENQFINFLLSFKVRPHLFPY